MSGFPNETLTCRARQEAGARNRFLTVAARVETCLLAGRLKHSPIFSAVAAAPQPGNLMSSQAIRGE